MVADRGAVLVTGGAGGIGRALLDTLTARGWSVLATGRTPRPDFMHASGRVRYVTADVTSADEIGAAVQASCELGPLVGCVANAGILAEDFSSVLDASPAAWSRTLEVNVLGVLTTFQAVSRVLARQGAGG